MTNTETIEYEIHRYQPGIDDAQTWQTYTVELTPGMTILDGLLQIRERQDASLVWRFSCRMGICGSCGMMINGMPGLACNTQILDISHTKIRLAPLSSFPVRRDLLVDLSPMFEKHRALKPYIVRQNQPEDQAKKVSPPVGDYQQSPEELLQFLQFSECIKCGACMAACPTVASDEQFPGPMPLAAAHRYNSDSRDNGFADRKSALTEFHGTTHCHYAAECSRACPKGVDPARAIALLGRSLVADALHLRRHRPADMLGPGESQQANDVPHPPPFTVTDSPANTDPDKADDQEP